MAIQSVTFTVEHINVCWTDVPVRNYILLRLFGAPTQKVTEVRCKVSPYEQDHKEHRQCKSVSNLKYPKLLLLDSRVFKPFPFSSYSLCLAAYYNF